MSATLSDLSAKHVRTGKTARDKANGAKSRNGANKDARVSWQKTSRKGSDFPLDTCNGQRSQALK
jgi:hypothetical protein